MADAVCAGLEAAGLKCWIAPRDITAGTDWGGAIIDAISSADALVLVFSSHANESPQIRREVERAVAKNVRVIPFRIEDVPPSRSLEYFVSTSHWMDALTGPLENHVRTLSENIRMLAETRDSRQVPPPLPRHDGARLGGADAAPREAAAAWKRTAAGVIAAAAVAAALYFFVLRKDPPQIMAVNFPPVVVAGGRDTVGTVQFAAGTDDVAEAEFQVVSADNFEPFSVRPAAADEKQGSFPFRIRSATPQQVTLRATLVDSHGRRSRPVSFSFEVRKAPASAAASSGRERTIEIPLPQGLKLKLPH